MPAAIAFVLAAVLAAEQGPPRPPPGRRRTARSSCPSRPGPPGWAAASAWAASPSTTSRAAGRSAGAVLRLGRRVRLGVDGEIGLQRSRASVEYLGGVGRKGSATVAYAGGRAKIELPFAQDQGAIGLSAFVREPLRTACVDVGETCDELGTTVGVVLHGSIALWRRGTGAGGAAPDPAP